MNTAHPNVHVLNYQIKNYQINTLRNRRQHAPQRWLLLTISITDGTCTAHTWQQHKHHLQLRCAPNPSAFLKTKISRLTELKIRCQSNTLLFVLCWYRLGQLGGEGFCWVFHLICLGQFVTQSKLLPKYLFLPWLLLFAQLIWKLHFEKYFLYYPPCTIVGF